ncbi:MAG: GIY-YIG nuclease family protein [Desulfomonile tiedjei]|uniref:GIY-YIG nuclease family protein n=1 Tax=Desulfomonile tiedjei TaxID=2358 RepID=A0A9D6UZP0_9BACT|nr:GIY-YIG nuclease family protein [Desulfomonile tiedjei]
MKSHHPASGNPLECYHETDSGAYQLILRLACPMVIAVGALGEHAFPAGSYVYTGRASKSLSKRILRHRRVEKKLRWHIDYLLQQAPIEGIQLYPGKATEECSINNETARALRGFFPIKGFGSSDCRCPSHLLLVPEKDTRKLKAMIARMSPREQEKS